MMPRFFRRPTRGSQNNMLKLFNLQKIAEPIAKQFRITIYKNKLQSMRPFFDRTQLFY